MIREHCTLIREQCSFIFRTMAKDKTETHIRIAEAAKREFMEYGFKDASMRRIASSAKITVSGLYKHYASKEEMFASLVDPVLNEMWKQYEKVEIREFSEIDEPDPDHIWEDKHETEMMMSYIYDHHDAFKLLICKSAGTRYEDLPHELAIREEETTLAYMDKLRKKGIKINQVDEKEFHLLVTTCIDAILEAVRHDFSKDEAMHYAQTLELFYEQGWKKLFGY